MKNRNRSSNSLGTGGGGGVIKHLIRDGLVTSLRWSPARPRRGRANESRRARRDKHEGKKAERNKNITRI